MKLHQKQQLLSVAAAFVAGADSAICVLALLGWLKLDTLPRTVALWAYLLTTLVAVAIPHFLGKRALKRQEEQAKRWSDQWKPVPGRPGILHREATVEFHGFLETDAQVRNDKTVADVEALSAKTWGPSPGPSR